jgi:SAM-dependent methyltransferase
LAPLEPIREFWNDDAATYDNSEGHRPRSPAVLAAWSAALFDLLPPVPAAVLDVGAGTGFLSLLAARLGHQVTALDVSPLMLAQLKAKAAVQGLDVTVVEGEADAPPPGPFDAVIERHLVWTLPDPGAALVAWRRVAPTGRLVLLSSQWGRGADSAERYRARAREWLRQRRGTPHNHHASYAPELIAALPFGTGTRPGELAELVETSGWGPARLIRLRDVEWTAAQELPLPERLFGVAPRFVVTASG